MSATVLTVRELNRLTRQAIELHLPLCWVAGEISNLTRASSGHVYFTLRDADAQVRCVMFRSRAQLLPWRPENGQQVEAQALATLYEARGDFQLNVEALRRGGMGRLYEAFLRLKAMLEAEGLFAVERKRFLPVFPRTIGIVTSPQAAALQDILTTLARRAPHVSVVLYSARVQGEDAGAQIAAAIARASHRAECDLLIVARGGGSLEDLWAFNEEAVARAISTSGIPVISGVGHETDTTIADFVADQRAATPTAAAELATAGWFAAQEKLINLSRNLHATAWRMTETRLQRLDLLATRLIHPARRLQALDNQVAHLAARLAGALGRHLRRDVSRLGQAQLGLQGVRPNLAHLHTRLRLAEERLQAAGQRLLTQRCHRLDLLQTQLNALAPEAPLSRGYSIVRDAAGMVVRDSIQAPPGSRIEIQFASGQATARIEST
ncbi:MAG: exodeoxyribonuclease VII large subunit [Proteobacteria bacterium]|nr:exodeoxyribonuclease VII large subunit [Pseudomonadota bacterium]HQR04554.1 exodeoxyribonuclease VII large subunit [Rhodocyclaceae bacterium]